MRLVIGTRGSELALAQSRWVQQRLLLEPSNGVDAVDLRIIKTRGDEILDVALNKVGGKGLFVKELERIQGKNLKRTRTELFGNGPAAIVELCRAACPSRRAG